MVDLHWPTRRGARFVVRFFCVAILLTFLLAPVGSRADDYAQPVPPDGKCLVAADKQWTPQEKFVWQRVCIGKDANFNETPGYGDDLDPRRPEGLPASRILRSSFLETILLKSEYRQALTRHGVRIVGARFAEVVVLEQANLGHFLALVACLFETGADLTHLRTAHAISFSGSRVEGTLNMSALHVGAGLYMGEGAEFADVTLGGARIDGPFTLTDSRVTGILGMNNLHVGAQLSMNRAEFANVDLGGARVDGALDLIASKVSGVLDMNEIQVNGTLFMRQAEFASINLKSAHIGGQLELDGSKVTGALQMEGLRIASNLLMRNVIDTVGYSAEFAEVILTSAHVGGSIYLGGAIVRGDFGCVRLEAEQDVWLNEGTFAGPIDFSLARVRGNLDLSGGEFPSPVDLTGTQIGGRLGLGSDLLGAKWSAEGTLILRNATVDQIPSLADAWAPRLELNGFTYRSVGAVDAFDDWFKRLTPYAAQPYNHLASVIQSQGNNEIATAVRYAGRDRERHESSWSQRAGLIVLWGSIGYGYYLWRASIWVAVLVIAGTMLLQRSDQGWRNGLRSWLDKAAFSFDMLLPIIKLREKHYQIDLQGGLRYYFYFHKIMGYVLASFLIAGLSGLTK